MQLQSSSFFCLVAVHFATATPFWRREWDTVGSAARLRFAFACSLFAKKLPPAAFLLAKSPLRVRIPFISKQKPPSKGGFCFGGESGIRTHGRRNRHRFSRPALSTTQTSLHIFTTRDIIAD